MKNYFPLVLALVLVLAGSALGQYKLNFVKSPDEASNTVLGYVAVYTPTNTFATNSTSTNWYVFAQTTIGNTQFTIPSTVPTLSYLAVETQGTNYLLSAPTNLTLYSTQALATLFTNQPVAPRPPVSPTISQ